MSAGSSAADRTKWGQFRPSQWGQFRPSFLIDIKQPGTYTYHCSFHAFMTATLKVVR